MPHPGGLQLLPETRRKLDIRIPGENRWLYVSTALLVLVAIIWGAGFLYAQSLVTKIKAINDEILTQEVQRQKDDEDKLLLFHAQTQQISALLKQHIFWTQALVRLAQLAQNQVQFKSIDADAATSTIKIAAAAHSYNDAGRQLNGFLADDTMTDVNLSGLSMQSGVLSFNIDLKFSPEKLILHP